MHPFMTFDYLGDIVEATYKTIYTGGTEFGSCVTRLRHVCGRLAAAGMIANTTRKKIENFLTRDMNLSKMQVISRHTNDVVLVNTEIHEQDSFDLREFIMWITKELCSDPIMKNSLCGRESYEGVKRVLNSYADKAFQPPLNEDWIDFYVCQDKVFFTKKDGQDIHLYVHQNENISSLFSQEYDDREDSQLGNETLLDGRIYYFDNGTVFVQSTEELIIRARNIRGGRYSYSRINGKIVDQLENGTLLFVEEDMLICLKSNGTRKELGNIKNMSRDQILNRLNSDRVSKEMLWKGLLFTLYDFDRMNFDNKLGNRLRFEHFFDEIPNPFMMNEVVDRLSEIEAYCYDGDVIKADGYIEAMGYIMSIENEQLDEKGTIDALIYLLDNIKTNPYERIVNNFGTGVIKCIEFFFGEVEEEPEVHFEGEEELKKILDEAADNMTVEQYNRKIDSIIAELERQIEEEERKEKEAKKQENAENEQR